MYWCYTNIRWATTECLRSWEGRSRAVSLFGRKRGAASPSPSCKCIAVCRVVAGRHLVLPSSSSSEAAELRPFGKTLATCLAGALIANRRTPFRSHTNTRLRAFGVEFATDRCDCLSGTAQVALASSRLAFAALISRACRCDFAAVGGRHSIALRPFPLRTLITIPSWPRSSVLGTSSSTWWHHDAP